jgi:thiamine biosynthesis lipoprotein
MQLQSGEPPLARRRVVVPHLASAPAMPPPAVPVLQLQGRTMGTTWQVKLVAPPASASTSAALRERLQALLQARLERVVRQMSTWEQDSDVSRFNRAAPRTPVPLPAEFACVLRYALAVARDSDGACDPTAGALVNAWGFGPAEGQSARHRAPPAEASLAAARRASGWWKLRFDAAAGELVQPGAMQLDFSAIAKGFAVDELSACLQAEGVRSYLVEVGGELRGAGTKPGGQPWWVELEQPDGAVVTQTVVALCGLSVATSGDYRRFFMHDGVRYCHALDPRTGRPVRTDVAAVTVLHPHCMAADALSTALMVMGADEGMTWAEQRGLAALFRLRTRAAGGALIERMTRAFEDLLQ